VAFGELAILARPDSAKDQWVYKHPDQTIPMKAQLTVDSDEVRAVLQGRQVRRQLLGRPPTPSMPRTSRSSAS